MADGQYRFAHFTVDAAERRLWQDGLPVELNARYLDALLLLLQEPGTLITKERFFEEVWKGIPVTDEALTQCIRTLRRQLGDSASSPRFIETVPKHGYRFIARVRCGEEEFIPHPAPPPMPRARSWLQCVQLGVAGTLGGAVAGLLGGLCYGFAGAAQSLPNGVGTLSVLLVLMSVSLVVAVLGAAGVSFGIALAQRVHFHDALRTTLGGALGGLCVGGFAKLLGLDAFQLLLGQSPRDLTGAFEGLLVGAAIGSAAWLGMQRARSLRSALVMAILIGGVVGAAIPLLGGRLLSGSLILLAESFPEARLRFDPYSVLGDGALAPSLMAGFEAALFSAGIVGAIAWVWRKQAERSPLS